MAGAVVSAQERRKLLAADSPRLGEVGLDFLELGRWGEALECLVAAGESSGLQRLRDLALAAGDYFYANAAARALGQELSTEQLAQIAQTARETGKDAFAAAAEADD
jgi:hypothetical protein